MACTRLAPSPTGALHLGNVRTFALTWLWARSCGATLAMRVEDIDGPRKKPETVHQIFEDLQWVGLDWDGVPLIQTTRLSVHQEALHRLRAQGLIYPCTCTRRDVQEAQSAPHGEDGLSYPGTCRGRWADAETAFAAVNRPVAWRFQVECSEPISFRDHVAGFRSEDPAVGGEDFVIGRYEPVGGDRPGYQLAVVIDDAFQRVDMVIRGDDLLGSTSRQVLLQRALGLPLVGYAHVPMVCGPDGRRLAKRHGDTRVRHLRERGVTAAEIRRWIEGSAGLPEGRLEEPGAAQYRFEGLPTGAVGVPPRWC